MNMPVTSPITQPVRQWFVALTASRFSAVPSAAWAVPCSIASLVSVGASVLTAYQPPHARAPGGTRSRVIADQHGVEVTTIECLYRQPGSLPPGRLAEARAGRQPPEQASERPFSQESAAKGRYSSVRLDRSLHGLRTICPRDIARLVVALCH